MEYHWGSLAQEPFGQQKTILGMRTDGVNFWSQRKEWKQWLIKTIFEKYLNLSLSII